MSDRMFEFDPAHYVDFFAREGYVHIPGGVTDAFYGKMARQVEHNMRTAVMKEFAIGDKQQAMYQFPEDGADYAQELCEAVGRVCGINPDDLVLSERHVKAYDADGRPGRGAGAFPRVVTLEEKESRPCQTECSISTPHNTPSSSPARGTSTSSAA